MYMYMSGDCGVSSEFLDLHVSHFKGLVSSFCLLLFLLLSLHPRDLSYFTGGEG